VSASVGDYFFVVVYWPAAGGSVKKPLLVLIALVLILVGGTFYYFVISYFGQDLLGRVIALPGTIAVIVGCVLLWEQTKTVLEPFTTPLLEPISTPEHQARFIKGCFDILRNLLMVGPIKYFAQKTGSVVLSIVYQAI
jgi:hypothetical protein